MDYLLDTHTFLWFINGDPDLSSSAKAIIQDKSVIKLISIASLWEISIKISIDKLKLSMPLDALPKAIESNGFGNLVIQFKHLQQLSILHHFHRDPFDRLLISQAITENLTIISADQHFKSYPINVVW